MFDFPNSPTLNQTTTAPNGATFIFDGAKWTTAENAVMNPGGGLYLPLSGSSPMTGPLTLSGNATQPLHAVPLQQVGTINVINVLDHGAKGDGSTNDYSAIQGVLNSVGGKATIFIPDTGQPYMTDPLQVPSGTDLLIHGTVKLRAGAANSLVNFNNARNVTIRGHGILDGNGSAQSITGAGTLGGDSASNVRVDGLTIQNAYNWNLNITRSTNVRINLVTIIGGVASNEFANACDNCWITNSTINGPTGDGGFTFYGGVTNCGMIGCVMTAGYAGAIGIYSDAPQPAPCSNIVIANNIIHNNRQGAVSIVNSGGTAGTLHSGVVITGNQLYANNNVGNIQYADVWISHGTGITISGNEISGSGSGSSATWGVFVGTASSHVNITGNTIYNEGIGGTAGGGVYIQAANDVLVEANRFYDNQTTHTMANAVLGNAGARNAIIGNSVGALGGTPITLVLAADTVLDVGAHVPITGGSMTGNLQINAPATGINYAGSNAIAFAFTGSTATLKVDGGNIANFVTSPFGSNSIAFNWTGSTVGLSVDGGSQGNVLTTTFAAGSQITLGGLTLTTGGPTWSTGSGAPASTQPVGSLYSRVGGAVGATLYVSRGAGTWAAVAGV